MDAQTINQTNCQIEVQQSKATLIVATINQQVQVWVKTEFQIEAVTLIYNLRENRTMHARGPVQPSVQLHENRGNTIFLNLSNYMFSVFWRYVKHFAAL